MARKALGKGLGALMGNQEAITRPTPVMEKGEQVERASLSRIQPSPLQPRKTFSEEKLDELAASIKEKGVIQPLIVREVNGKLELIAGERRWRASQRAGIQDAPVIIRKVSDIEVLELALIENLQRADLNPVEEAEGFQRLMKEFSLTQEQVAQTVGRSRTAVANAVRLLSLDGEVKGMLSKGNISVGHGKVLLGVSSEREQMSLAREVVAKNLTVRETEDLVKRLSGDTKVKNKSKSKKGGSGGADWRDLENQLQRVLGTKVRIVGTGDKGHIEIAYFSDGDLERLLSDMGIQFD